MIRGFACGVFDLYHPGHVLMLRECSENCDHLTLALNTADDIDPNVNPGKRQPIFSLEERQMVLESVKYIDEICSYSSEEELTKLMNSGNFNIRFLGDDYKGKKITAPGAIEKIYYLDRSHGFSSTAIVNRILKRNDKI